MNKIMHKLIAYLAIAIFAMSSALNTAVAESEEDCEKKEIVIIFFNGVSNTVGYALNTLQELRNIHGDKTKNGTPILYSLAYNTTNGEMVDVLETFEQRMLELQNIMPSTPYEFFWVLVQGNQKQWVEGLIEKVPLVGTKINDFLDFVENHLVNELRSSLLHPPTIDDYVNHQSQINYWISNDIDMVFVAHSQGNLFVNEAYDFATTKTSPDSVKVVHIAPASIQLNGQHTLADLDLVINSLRLTLTGVPSITNFIPGYLLRPPGINGPDIKGHGMLAIYINQRLAISARVKNHINDALEELEAKNQEECETDPDNPSTPNSPDRNGGGSTGDPHLKTLDNLTYNFQAVGEFILLKSPYNDLEVQVRQVSPGRSRTVSMNNAVAMNVHTSQVVIYADRDEIFINGEPETITGNKDLEGGGTIELSQNGSSIKVTWNDGSLIQVDKKGSNPYLDLFVNLSDEHQGQVSGLLGNFDGNSENEFITREGQTLSTVTFDSLYDVFGNSWRISQDESLFVYFNEETTETFTNLLYPYASVSIDELPVDQREWAESICQAQDFETDINLNNCILDVALTGEDIFATSKLPIEKASIPQEVVVEGKREAIFPHVTPHYLFSDYNISEASLIRNTDSNFTGMSFFEDKWLFDSGYGEENILMTRPLSREAPGIYTIKTNNKNKLYWSMHVQFGRTKIEFLKDGEVIGTFEQGDAAGWHSGSIDLPENTSEIQMKHSALASFNFEFVYWSQLEAGD